MQKQLEFGEPTVSVEQAGSPDGYSGLYGFHKYWGKKPYEPIAYAIQQLTQPGEIVVDPFLGSGTSAREAIVRNRRFIGFDVNPVAVELTKFIASPPSESAVRNAFHSVEKAVKARIFDSYRLHSGDIATHYLWDKEELKQVWVKGNAGSSRLELAPTSHDLDDPFLCQL